MSVGVSIVTHCGPSSLCSDFTGGACGLSYGCAHPLPLLSHVFTPIGNEKKYNQKQTPLANAGNSLCHPSLYFAPPRHLCTWKLSAHRPCSPIEPQGIPQGSHKLRSDLVCIANPFHCLLGADLTPLANRLGALGSAQEGTFNAALNPRRVAESETPAETVNIGT